jgi:HEAT repeat protein
MKTCGVLAALFLVVLVFVVLQLRKTPKEPEYQDKSLTKWLRDLDFSYRPQDVQASNAVHQMGTNILPFLGPMLRARDSNLKVKAFQILSRQHVVKINFTPPDERRQRASRACRVLGTNAVQYLPELTEMLDSTNNRVAWCGFVAIGSVKPGAQNIPELTKALTNGYRLVRSAAASHLGNFKEKAVPAVPQLIACLKDPDPEVRGNALTALQRILSEGEAVVAVLTRGLDDPSPAVRRSAAIALGQMEQNAKAARTKLAEYENDPDEGVRTAVKFALRKIDDKK